MVEKVLSLNRKYNISVAWAHDINSLAALQKAVYQGLVTATLIGKVREMKKLCLSLKIEPDIFSFIESGSEEEASSEAVRMANEDSADIIMKGLVGTEKFLKAVLDKETGLMLPDAVLSYVGAVEIPSYHKLLFITDPAVIPYPDLNQKMIMARYAIEMTSRFGIENPKIALIGPTEKVSRHFPNSFDYQEMCRMAEQGLLTGCIMDGPLDLFLACDRESVKIKGVNTRINGDADVLLFPSLESCNPFYKSLMLFAGGKLAGMLTGTKKPVVVMSRSESEESKFYCIALSCLMVNKH